MRARLALAISEQNYTLHEVDLKNRPAELFAVSAAGTVPVLVLDDGSVLHQSLDIMRWTLGNHDPHGWLPTGAKQTAETQVLLAQCDGELKFHLDRYKYSTRYVGASMEEHRGLAAGILWQWNQKLTEDAFLCGPKPGLADYALGPFVRQFANAERAWFDSQPWAALRQWLDAFTASALFARIMQKS